MWFAMLMRQMETVGYDELAMVNGKLAQVVKIMGDEVTFSISYKIYIGDFFFAIERGKNEN